MAMTTANQLAMPILERHTIIVSRTVELIDTTDIVLHIYRGCAKKTCAV